MLWGKKPPPEEPCHPEACAIQRCMAKEDFQVSKCLAYVKKLQACCDSCKGESKHCSQLSNLLSMVK
eukprot:SM000042S15352  [mRNA]  locus=s42:565859:566239:+ [translate_table: standard]